jgi:hypothetical protein
MYLETNGTVLTVTLQQKTSFETLAQKWFVGLLQNVYMLSGFGQHLRQQGHLDNTRIMMKKNTLHLVSQMRLMIWLTNRRGQNVSHCWQHPATPWMQMRLAESTPQLEASSILDHQACSYKSVKESRRMRQPRVHKSNAQRSIDQREANICP